ncbi:MAG: putative pterin-4-alpha-carbinolamine dehydratase [Frankiales bacterium]|nr:putative pterin-4-alpha-carbinolamine dehydratase [Frankiales bacterium]
MPTVLDDALLSDTLQSLPGWEGDQQAIWRDVHLDDEQDAELRRQIETDSGAMHHPPQIEDRGDGTTRILLRTAEAGGVTEVDIALASHISDLAHRLKGSEPGVNAVRPGDSVIIYRAADDELPLVEAPTVQGGAVPVLPEAHVPKVRLEEDDDF